MPVFHLNSLPKEKRIQMIGEFYDIIDSLKDRTEVRLFLKSLLSPEEIAMLMRRIEIAVLLSANLNYNQIIEMLGVGSNKITSVHKCLQQDDNGYKIIIKRLIENRKKRLKKIKKENKEKTDMSPMSAVKKKYPGYFLLNNLLDVAVEKLEEDDKILEKEALLFTPSLKHSKKI
ncbi:MAG: TrpR-like protein YerC/YecD [Parcubacteria group bacterium Licking1014_1]|nr:MAG: TrpR-like protein YerC/YecD [Parcubacteria group bacterium Licking1014_1]